MKKQISGWFTIFIFFMLSSCNEEEALLTEPRVTENHRVLTIKEKSLVQNLKQSSLVLTGFIRNDQLFQRIAERVGEKPEGRNAVNFTELFDQSKTSARLNSEFKNRFTSTLNTGNYPLSHNYPANNYTNARSSYADLESFLKQEDIQIYWPYREVWDGETLPTLTYVPLNNDHENEGFKIIQLADGTYDTRKVIVNDDYAWENPTWIFRKRRALPESMNKMEKNARADGKARINTVRIKDLLCKEHLDGLFNKGESEIYFVGAETAGSESAVTREIYIEVTRYAVRKKRWRTYDKIFDYNWRPEEVVNAIAVIDYDKNKKDQTISGSVSYTPKDENGNTTGPTVTAQYSVTLKSERRPLMQNGLDREWFFERNWSDNGDGTINGRAVYDADPVYFTLEVLEYD